MKNIFTTITFIISLHAAAQKSEIITDSSKAKSEIFSKTFLWIQNTWGDPDKVTDAKDEASGVIHIKGGLKAVPKADGFAVKGMTLTELTIQVTEGQAKLNFDHTTFKWDAGTIWNFGDDDGGTQKQQWKTEVLSEIDEMIAGYKAALK